MSLASCVLVALLVSTDTTTTIYYARADEHVVRSIDGHSAVSRLVLRPPAVIESVVIPRPRTGKLFPGGCLPATRFVLTEANP